tara:strand:+ start:1471 stop:2472 length:1002 start_codon:yes stop_codon:yes gene_type:complete
MAEEKKKEVAKVSEAVRRSYIEKYGREKAYQKYVEDTKNDIGSEVSATGTSNPSAIVEQELSPEYIYATNQNVEDFNNLPFKPIKTSRNNLAPPSAFKPKKKRKIKNEPINEAFAEFCKKYPHSERCGGDFNAYCDANPSDPRCHDEQDEYKDLGFFQEQVRHIFDPNERSEQNKIKKPVSTLYESTRDNTQLDAGQVIRTECLCKDGTKRMGWLDVRSGQKDCSPCKKSVFNSPNIYKNYKTKRSQPTFSGKSVPLRKQVGVSHFGDVNMKGCQTGNAEQTTERRNAISTLNNITNIDTRDSIGGSTITAPQNNSGLPISLYDNLKSNVYGL